MHATRRVLVITLAISILAGLLAVVPDAATAPPAEAKAAPQVPLPPCIEDEFGNMIGACPSQPPEVGVTASGRFSGSGATSAVTIQPNIPACTSWPNRSTWNPSPCWSNASISTGSPVHLTEDGDLVSSGSIFSPGAGSYTIAGRSTGVRLYTGETYQSERCNATRSNFGTYVYGGHQINAPWSSISHYALSCELRYEGDRPDALKGPTWIPVTASLEVESNGTYDGASTARTWIPLDGDLANPGPDAAFESVESEPGRYRFTNTSSHENDLSMTYAWDFGDGGTSTATSPTHTYDKPGSYQVSLTAEDSEDLTDTATATVDVAAPTLGASFTLGTESGTGAVGLEEEFDVTLRIAATDGVGDIRGITAADPFANASNLEVQSGPTAIGPFTLTPGSHQDLTWRVKASEPGRFTLRTTPSGTDAADRPANGNEAEANGSVGGFLVDVEIPEETVKLAERTEGERDENGQLLEPGFIPAEIPITLKISIPENGVALTDIKPFEIVEGDGGIDVDAVRKFQDSYVDLTPQPVPFPVTWTGPTPKAPEEGPAPSLPFDRLEPGQSLELDLTLTVERPGSYEISSIFEGLTAPDVGEPKVVRGTGTEVLPVAGDAVLAVEIHADRDQGAPPRVDEGDSAQFTGSLTNLSLTDTVELKPLIAKSLGQGVVVGPVELTDDFPEPGQFAIFDPVLEPGEEVSFKARIETTVLPGVDMDLLLPSRESVILDLEIGGEVVDPEGGRRDIDPEVDLTVDVGNGKWTNGVRVEVEPKLVDQPLLETSDFVWALYGETAESVGLAGYNFGVNAWRMLNAIPSLPALIGTGGSKVIDLTADLGQAEILAVQYAWTWAEMQGQIVAGLDPSEKQAFIAEISADLAKLYDEDIGAVTAAVNTGIEGFFTAVLEYKGAADQAGATGDVGKLIELTGDAVEVGTGVVLEEISGQAVMAFLARAARSERVATALARARAKLDVEEVRKLEAATDEMRSAQVNPKVSGTPDSLKGVSPGTPVSTVQAIRGWAIDKVSDANLRLLTSEKPIMVAIRSRADETLEWLETTIGITPKPVTIKPKNVNLDDCNFLGYRCGEIGYTPDGSRSLGDRGSVAMREPLSRQEVIRRLDAAGIEDGIARDRILNRHNKRWKEWYGEDCPIAATGCVVPEIPKPSKWQEMLDKTPNEIIGEDGLRIRQGELEVPRKGTPPEPKDNFDTAGKPGVYDKREFQLREVRSDDGKEYWEVWLEDSDGVMKRVSGDIDTVSVTDTAGRSLDPDSDFAREVSLDLQEGMDAQHPWSSSLTNPELRKEFLEAHVWDPDPLKRGEPLLVYVDGEARVGWFDPAKFTDLVEGTDTEPLASMLWLEGGPNNLDAIAKRQVDLRQKIVDPLSVPTPWGHIEVETAIRSALLKAKQLARVTGDAAEIQRTADRYATCAIDVSRTTRAPRAVWRLSDTLQKRQADGSWADADPATDCDGGGVVVLPSTALLEDVVAGVTELPIIEELLGYDWKDMFRIGDCITIDPGKENEEKACIVDHGSLILDRPLEHDHEASAIIVMDDPGGSYFNPITPTRIIDSRASSRTGPYGTPWPSGQSRSVQVAGVAGVPADADAVVLNVTAVGPTGGGYLTVHPSGETRPVASNVNFVPGQTVPNSVTVKVGDGGRIEVFNSFGATDVVIDVAGYFAEEGSGYDPIEPTRIIDSRPGSQVGPYGTAWSSGASRKVQVRGQAGVPDDADGVVLNVTAVDPTGGGFLTIHPSGEGRPTASSVNFVPNQTVPNSVTVKLGDDGAIDVYNSFGATHVVIDVAGYYSAEGYGYFAVSPERIQDSRPESQHGPYSGPWGHGAVRTVQVVGAAGVPPTAAAVSANVTAVTPTTPGFLTLFPTGGGLPLASNLNFVAGQTVPNSANVKLGADGALAVYNHSGATHVLVDVAGYYA